ncbi:MAG: (2Fe-2S) ferredoxin domain-containing protein [Spirochaetia bacterium]|nr:(2Fe-2S) ferredoxin domain-containing protein [Spirochaetia bacterium]MBR4437019.1 (2Fe-2S) ferredoxin domain-containing protein [Spirochaetales bacterium]MBR4797450.1 (2Fe-2S) ferredoxin domain-containing protein [Spirochaetia bacterium]MBR5017131.1 (2Fe-2S) ferredoxin domain-containing protein [Spirochaetia bacterium]MBR5914830.1 (2Fe-2S) ferredoxin domain-containing protein [Spirochaetia bacterium]
MAKMTLEALRALREGKKAEIDRRETDGKDVHIIIGMGTCGIAAGAKQVLEAFIDEIAAKKIENVTVKQTGCMGLCYVEPTVEVKVPGMPDTIYGKVDADVARKILKDHVIGKKLVSDHIFDRPSTDILK